VYHDDAMTSRDPAPEPSAVDGESLDDLDAAELEELEDDAERERQKARSALVGLIALVVVLALTGIGVWTAVDATSRVPDPGISRQLPAQP
jgi:hypothetical protein